MSLNSIREKINLRLYDSKEPVLRIFKTLSFLVSFSAIAIMIYYYGFPQTDDTKDLLLRLIKFSFGFYILHYVIRFVYDFKPLQFLKNSWFEGLLMLLLLVEGISYNLFGTLLLEPVFVGLGIKGYTDLSTVFVQMFIFVVLINNLLVKGNFTPWFKIHPSLLFATAISTLTLTGTGLLMLPEMTILPGGLNFIDSLFMSMSSVSVTGLTTVDLSHAMTFKGQLVVLAMIKLGGLNTIAFGALLLVVGSFGVGIKYHEVIEDFVNRDSILDSNSMLAKIVLWSLGIEIVGTILLYIGFGDKGIFADQSVRLFQAIFHGVSGFNNAGLSILPGGMMHPDVINNYFVHGIILSLFFLGGLGMIYVIDLFEISRLRERLQKPWKTIEFGTKISLYFTVGLLIFGAVVFYAMEHDKTLQGKGIVENLVFSLYESMTTRNAGFNVVDTASLSLPVLIIFLFLMFVGASSGSAGGGIRTSTFAVMSASLVSTIRGKKNTELFKRTISNDLVMKSYAIFLFFVVANVIGPFILSISEADLLASGKFGFLDLVFEHVSAACTVGLSTGITSELSVIGKYVLIIAMFIGRVGTLTLAYLFGKSIISTHYKYPEAHTMVG